VRKSYALSLLIASAIGVPAAFAICSAPVFISNCATCNTAFNARPWFNSTSPWNVAISNSTPTAYSANAIADFISSGANMDYNMDLLGVTVLYSDEITDPLVNLVVNFGAGNNFEFHNIPLDPNWISYARWNALQLYDGVHQYDTDAKVCEYDATASGFYSWWLSQPNAGGVSVGSGGFSSQTGPGGYVFGGTASKQSYCAGLIRADEWATGTIHHALALVWPANLTLSTNYVFPAAFSDGTGTNSARNARYGARLQLDPTMTDTQLRNLGLNTKDLIIAHALQTYGAYLIDTGPGGAIEFQNAFGNGTNVYGAFGQGTVTFGNPNHMHTALLSHLRFVAPPSVVTEDDFPNIPTYCGSAPSC
jgi:hypothetical protein